MSPAVMFASGLCIGVVLTLAACIALNARIDRKEDRQ